MLFPPNCTSWKQSWDMGFIAALKKRYKYLYLKDVLDFYELDEKLKSKQASKGPQRKSKQKGFLEVQQVSLIATPSHLL